MKSNIGYKKGGDERPSGGVGVCSMTRRPGIGLKGGFSILRV